MKINTPIFNDQQKRFALILLSLFHIFIITASNYFVQIPFEINLKLTALGFNIEEASWLNPVPNVWSVHIRDKDCPQCFLTVKARAKKPH